MSVSQLPRNNSVLNANSFKTSIKIMNVVVMFPWFSAKLG